jgi:hypothetical protein
MRGIFNGPQYLLFINDCAPKRCSIISLQQHTFIGLNNDNSTSKDLQVVVHLLHNNNY